MAKAIKNADLKHNLDPSRFYILDEATRDRLREKYKHAIIVLNS
jgi:hypothetical protein